MNKFIDSSLNLFRLGLKPRTGRSCYAVNGFFVKEYEDVNECMYEYTVLQGIATANPSAFLVPKVFRVNVSSRRSYIVMERIYGYSFQDLIIKFLLFRKSDAIRIFNDLGRALRELHYINIRNLRKCLLPDSLQKIKLEIHSLSEKLEKLRVLDYKFRNRMLDAVEEITYVTNEIFTNVNLHGEFYFTHIILSNGKYVFLDFHRTCRGPSYFDLAMLSTSLYTSITLPYLDPSQLIPLLYSFLTGYYGRGVDVKLIKSMKIAELYVTLREILLYAGLLYTRNPWLMKLTAMLKIKRLKTAIEKVILPALIND